MIASNARIDRHREVSANDFKIQMSNKLSLSMVSTGLHQLQLKNVLEWKAFIENPSVSPKYSLKLNYR